MRACSLSHESTLMKLSSTRTRLCVGTPLTLKVFSTNAPPPKTPAPPSIVPSEPQRVTVRGALLVHPLAPGKVSWATRVQPCSIGCKGGKCGGTTGGATGGGNGGDGDDGGEGGDGGDGGSVGGAGGRVRRPQSVQSVPRGQMAAIAWSCPSSQKPLPAKWL